MLGSLIQNIAARVERANDKPQRDVLYPITGIDVSHHKGKVDWSLVRDEGHNFMFAKSTEGVGFDDDLCGQNVKAAKQAGLITGVYHFATVPPGNVYEDAKLEVDWALKYYRKRIDNIDLPMVLDIERTDGRKAKDVLAFTLAWVDEWRRRTGHLPIVYTGPNFWRYSLMKTSKLRQCTLWMASYSSAPEPKKTIAGWPWTFWQHTGKGRCAGVGGGKKNVDLNRFAGTLQDLIKLKG